MIVPLQHAFGWSRGTISAADLGQPDAVRPDRAVRRRADGAVRPAPGRRRRAAAGRGRQRPDRLHDRSWQLVLCWGVLVGLGTGSMALAFVATVTSRWFVARRGLVTGILTAGGATGQLIFLPRARRRSSPRTAGRPPSLTVAAGALLVAPLAVWLLRDYPADVGAAALRRHGRRRRCTGRPPTPAPARAGPPDAVERCGRRRVPARSGSWSAAFAICGATHQRPGRHAFHPGRARPRPAARRPRPACSRWSACSTSSARSSPAG